MNIKDGKNYHYPDEPAAVMFALRHSYDAHVIVFDPDGNIVVEFKPRKRWERNNPFSDRNDDLLVEIARAGGAPPLKTDKAKPSKRLVKKGR